MGKKHTTMPMGVKIKGTRLTPVEYKWNDKANNAMYLFQCECGGEKVIRAYDVKKAKTKSCGCLKKQIWKSYQHKYEKGNEYYKMRKATVNKGSFKKGIKPHNKGKILVRYPNGRIIYISRDDPEYPPR